MITLFAVSGMNPEPWKSPSPQIGWRGKKPYATMIKDGRLTAYQEAIRESVEDLDPRMHADASYLQVEMLFWRKLEEYTPVLGRKSKRKWADATNMGKALEDAMQGVFYKNDARVLRPLPNIVEQHEDTEELIVVRITDVFSSTRPTTCIQEHEVYRLAQEARENGVVLEQLG